MVATHITSSLENHEALDNMPATMDKLHHQNQNLQEIVQTIQYQ